MKVERCRKAAAVSSICWRTLCIARCLTVGVVSRSAPGKKENSSSLRCKRTRHRLLRFRTGDRVRWLPFEACSCGRPFAGVEAGTVARYDNMLKIKMINVWPDAVDAVVLTPTEVAEYQGEVRIDRATGREQAVVSIEFQPQTTVEIRVALLTELAEQLHERCGLQFACANTTGHRSFAACATISSNVNAG